MSGSLPTYFVSNRSPADNYPVADLLVKTGVVVVGAANLLDGGGMPAGPPAMIEDSSALLADSASVVDDATMLGENGLTGGEAGAEATAEAITDPLVQAYSKGYNANGLMIGPYEVTSNGGLGGLDVFEWNASRYSFEANIEWLQGAADAGQPVFVNLPEGYNLADCPTLVQEIGYLLNRGYTYVDGWLLPP
jgi:hypothetical protein